MFIKLQWRFHQWRHPICSVLRVEERPPYLPRVLEEAEQVRHNYQVRLDNGIPM